MIKRNPILSVNWSRQRAYLCHSNPPGKILCHARVEFIVERLPEKLDRHSVSRVRPCLKDPSRTRRQLLSNLSSSRETAIEPPSSA